jgi:hypothetical protein
VIETYPGESQFVRKVHVNVTCPCPVLPSIQHYLCIILVRGEMTNTVLDGTRNIQQITMKLNLYHMGTGDLYPCTTGLLARLYTPRLMV